MASWIDVFSLVITTFFFVGSILGVFYAARAISSSFQSIKTSLEQRGITLSQDGVSVKTHKRFDRESYVDATQRGLVKMLGAATVGPETHKHALLPSPKSTSGSSSTRDEKHVFGVALRRSQSDECGECH